MWQIKRIINDRWAHAIPQEDQGALEDFEMLSRVEALHPTHAYERVKNRIETMAPWMTKEHARLYLDDYPGLDHRRLWPSRQELREKLFLHNADRERLRVFNIPPCDMTDAQLAQHNRVKKRARDTARRRKAGAKPRSSYLEKSTSKSEPESPQHQQANLLPARTPS